MKIEKEIQTAWEIWILINRLNDLLWDRYEEDFPEFDLQEQKIPAWVLLVLWRFINAQDKKEG